MQLFSNNVVTTLNGAITAIATSIPVTDGGAMPSPTGGNFFLVTLSDGTNVEIVKCTARSTNTLTLVRAQEGTTGFAFADLDAVELRATAGTFSGVAQLASTQTFTKAQRGSITALTDGATITPDFALNNFYSVTLAGNRTLANPTSIVANQSGSIFMTQDATGSRSLAFGSYWDFAGGTAPTLSTAANTVDRLDYLVRTTGSIHAVLTRAWA
jgi:hypothetical protein